MNNAVFHLTVLMTVYVSVKLGLQGVVVTPAYLDTPGEEMDRAAQVNWCYVSTTIVMVLMKLNELIINHTLLSVKMCDEEGSVCRNGGTCINFQRCICPDNFTGM